MAEDSPYRFFCSHRPESYEQTAINKKEKPWIYSNWYPIKHFNDGNVYCCVEQDMMHHKALLFGDKETAEKILQTEDPKQIKELGRQIANFDQNKWDGKKYRIVLEAVDAKFRQNDELLSAMLSVTRPFVEAASYDRVWGIGFHANDAMANEQDWGQNLLGNILDVVREMHCHM